MKNLTIFTIIICVLNSCSTSNNKLERESFQDSVLLNQIDGLEEPLKSDTSVDLSSIEELIIDEAPIKLDSTGRPSRPIFKNTQVDTTELFGIWTVDPTGPHADFWLTKDSYYVVDYDGDGDMPYILDGRTLTIFFEHGKQVLEILSTSNDTLRTFSKEYEYETLYIRWKN
ncbi:MAG: hypothetical protein OCD76_17930 [Reichenbachiella sp.]